MSYYILIAITIVFFAAIFYSIFKDQKNSNVVNSMNIDRTPKNQNAYSRENSSDYIKNRVAKLIKVISIISLIIGVIIGITQLDTYSILGITYIVISIISSIFVYGLGEIIQLLEDIKNKK